jgi:two-component system NtrC family response regulator
MTMEKLLIVDDSDDIRKQLRWGLGKDYTVFLAGNGEEALTVFKKHQPKVVTLDLGLPPDENGTEIGFKCLREILGSPSRAKVIVVTGNDERESALRAIEMGAYDFYQKPIDLKELKIIIGRAFHLSSIEEENARLRRTIETKTSEFGGMIGHCPEMLKIFSTIRKVAPSDVPVLIMGESGTGKELVARAIHLTGMRREFPFVPINCGAIPENLLESELFGHERGAFTGAHTQVLGKVEYAHKGVLFLDEIAELPTNLQVKLLRFLQDKKIQRVGGRDDIQVDTRIVAATNKDITKEIEAGRFREDLFYRIGVIAIKLPPLRERPGDITLLSRLFLSRFIREFGKKVSGFGATAVQFLNDYEWPGNVRELENRIQRAIIMSESPLIEPQDLGFVDVEVDGQKSPAPESLTLREARNRAEYEAILASIKKHEGNIVRAAEELEVSRPTLYDLMRKHGLSV